jgi:hypothetical protein
MLLSPDKVNTVEAADYSEHMKTNSAPTRPAIAPIPEQA